MKNLNSKDRKALLFYKMSFRVIQQTAILIIIILKILIGLILRATPCKYAHLLSTETQIT